MKTFPSFRRFLVAGALAAMACVPCASGNNSVHLAYHWHLHQPVYWPETNPHAAHTNRYQFAADSIDLKLGGTGNFYPGSPHTHPRNLLVSGDGGEYDPVFDKADRVIAYQFGGRDSITTILSHPDGGASVSYSGALQENIWSLGKDNRYGYGPNWNQGYSEARGSTATWRTSGGYPRADMVGMTYHHSFSPLLPRSVLRKEIQIFKEIWWKSWNGNPDQSDHSKGFWPIECAFSPHMIPTLLEEGYEWVIVPNSHLARTCTNYLDVAQKGTSGWNIDPPNRADQLGPFVPAEQWWNGQLDGRGGAFPAPFAYQAHRVKSVNPETGVESLITVVPMCDLLSYQNGFATMGTGDIDAHIAPYNDANHPSLVLMAHDGDNAWGGGNSYYQESVPNLFNAAAGQGYRPTTIQQFLTDHPVPSDDVVHIEDGAWVNAANDWGHPQFINWLWPPTRSPGDPAYNSNDPRTWYDIENGWTEDWRNWAILMAGANYCETAEQISLSTGGSVQAAKIQEPVQPDGTSNDPNAAEQAWHYYLAGLDSGFMYYGTSLDDEVKQTLAVNRAIAFATNVIGDGSLDQTPPTVFKPQRFPWNPGGMGWGPLTGYKAVGFDGNPAYSTDFCIWTHVFDVSGVTNVTLFVRQDSDGVNPLDNNDNETYAGGPGVSGWSAIPMTRRAIPTTNVTSDPNINFFLLPTAIADHYWAKVVGYTNVLLDYYIQAIDVRGNTHKSGIQHVWVDSGAGSGTGGGGGSTNACDGRVCIEPAPAVQGSPVNIYYSPEGGPLAGSGQIYLHLGWNNWDTVVNPDPAMSFNASSNRWEISVTAPVATTQLDCVFNNGSQWDNNSGADWHFAVVTNDTPQPPSTPIGLTANAVNSNQVNLSWSAAFGATGYVIWREGAPIAGTQGTSYGDVGLLPEMQYCYAVTATNAIGTSPPSSPACVTTPSGPVTNLPPFVMDGAADFSGYLLATNGPQLYAAVRGSELYVACQSAANGHPNDHFIFVTDQLLGTASAPAPWAKAGLTAVANTKPFIGAEGANDYESWFNAPPGANVTKAPSGSGVLEGTLDLVSAFGSLPTVLYVAAAAYTTLDGGTLVSIAPSGTGPNVDPGEFMPLPLEAFRDVNADGLYDRLDPNLDFRIISASEEGSGLRFSFASVPGRSYRVLYRESLTDTWSVLAGSQQTASALQTTLSITNIPGTPHRFYRVELLP